MPMQTISEEIFKRAFPDRVTLATLEKKDGAVKTTYNLLCLI